MGVTAHTEPVDDFFFFTAHFQVYKKLNSNVSILTAKLNACVSAGRQGPEGAFLAPSTPRKPGSPPQQGGSGTDY